MKLRFFMLAFIAIVFATASFANESRDTYTEKVTVTSVNYTSGVSFFHEGSNVFTISANSQMFSVIDAAGECRQQKILGIQVLPNKQLKVYVEPDDLDEMLGIKRKAFLICL